MWSGLNITATLQQKERSPPPLHLFTLTLVRPPLGGKDSLHRFCGCSFFQLIFSSMSIQNLPFHQNSPLRATVEAVPWRPLRSTRTSLCVWTQKAHLAPARFASECEVRCFASAMPVRSMRPRAGSEHEHSIVDSVSAHQPKSKSAATHRLPMWLRSACSDAGGMTIPVRSSSAHARDSQCGLPQGGSGLRRPTTTFLEVSLTSCWRRPGQWMWRGG